MLIDEARKVLANVDACFTGELPVVKPEIPEEEVWFRLKAAHFFGICEEQITELLNKKHLQK